MDRRTVTLLGVTVAAPAAASETEPLQHSVGMAHGEAHPVTPPVDHVMPDLPSARPPRTEGGAGIRPRVMLLGDQAFCGQDGASLGQVGEQRRRWEMQAARPQLLGHVGQGFRIRYQIAGEFEGFAGDPETDWSLTDRTTSLPHGPRTTLRLGKAKQPFVYEMAGDAANLSASERVLSPFFLSRNTGARLSLVWGPATRGTLSLGLHKDSSCIGTAAGAERGWDVSGRLTALVRDAAQARNVLHLGASFGSAASAGMLRRDRGRPGRTVASNVVDTGSLPADGVFRHAVEGLPNLRNVSLLGEWVAADTDPPTTGNLRFSGWYLAGSWVLTGETRPHDRNGGYARRIIPEGRWGAPEPVVRCADADLTTSRLTAAASSGGTWA